MSYILISLLLILINTQIQDIWKPEDLWNYIKQDIEPRDNTGYGVVDPNSYIRTQTTVELEDYLATLYKNSGMSVFVIIVKQLENKNLLNDSTSVTFKSFSESKFDINPDKLILMIYSVEDKGYKIVVGKSYKLKTNTAIIKDIYNEVHPFLETKKVFIVVITACTKIEGFKQLSADNKDDIEEEEENNISTQKDNIKYNDSSKIFPLSFIIIILVILIIISIFFVFKNSKRFKKLKRLDKDNVDYNMMKSLNDN